MVRRGIDSGPAKGDSRKIKINSIVGIFLLIIGIVIEAFHFFKVKNISQREQRNEFLKEGVVQCCIHREFMNVVWI